MQRRPELEQKVMRGTVLVAFALGLALLGFAALPNYELHALDGTQVVTTRDGLESWLVATVVLLLGPGVLVWFVPRLLTAALWSPMSLFCVMAMSVVTFKLELDWKHDVVELWPVVVTQVLMIVLAAGVVIAVPLACIAYGLVTRERRPPPPPTLPVARVI